MDQMLVVQMGSLYLLETVEAGQAVLAVLFEEVVEWEPGSGEL